MSTAPVGYPQAVTASPPREVTAASARAPGSPQRPRRPRARRATVASSPDTRCMLPYETVGGVRKTGRVRVATWNVNSVGARLPRLNEWLELAQPDVLCLQETKIAGDAFPGERAEELGYEVAANGDGRWNGVAILSRVGLTDLSYGFTGQPPYAPPVDEDDPALIGKPPAVEARALGATCGSLRIWSLYVPNGRIPGQPALRLQARVARRAAHCDRTRGPSRWTLRHHRRLQHRADRQGRLGSRRLHRFDARHRCRAQGTRGPARTGPR